MTSKNVAITVCLSAFIPTDGKCMDQYVRLETLTCLITSWKHVYFLSFMYNWRHLITSHLTLEPWLIWVIVYTLLYNGSLFSSCYFSRFCVLICFLAVKVPILVKEKSLPFWDTRIAMKLSLSDNMFSKFE